MRHRLKTGPEPRPWTWKKPDPLKNGPVGKTGSHGWKLLPFFLGHMKDNTEAIHFHIKSRGVPGLVFVQITFEKSLFWKQWSWYKNDDCQFAAFISMITHFYSIKTYFHVYIEFYIEYWTHFHKTVKCFWKFNN